MVVAFPHQPHYNRLPIVTSGGNQPRQATVARVVLPWKVHNFLALTMGHFHESNPSHFCATGRPAFRYAARGRTRRLGGLKPVCRLPRELLRPTTNRVKYYSRQERSQNAVAATIATRFFRKHNKIPFLRQRSRGKWEGSAGAAFFAHVWMESSNSYTARRFRRLKRVPFRSTIPNRGKTNAWSASRNRTTVFNGGALI